MNLQDNKSNRPILFIAGSRRFASHVQNIYEACHKAGITVILGREPDRLHDNCEETTSDILRRIDKANIVYVLADAGYIGDTVATEIVYAHSHGKAIIASEPLCRSEINAKVTCFILPSHLVDYLKVTVYNKSSRRAA